MLIVNVLHNKFRVCNFAHEMRTKNTQDIDFLADKRVFELTAAELRELIIDAIVAGHNKACTSNNVDSKQYLIRGAKALGEQLGCSTSTVNRWIRDKVLTPPAIVREGRMVFFDLEEVYAQLISTDKIRKGGVRLRG